MRFLVDDEGLAINTALITAVKIKKNRNDGAFKNNRNFPIVADIHVSGRERPFTTYLTESQSRELSQFVKDNGMGDAQA